MSNDAFKKISTVTNSVFEAAIGETSWENAIRDLVSSHGASGGSTFDFNSATGELSNWHYCNLEATNEYLAEMNAINPRMHYSLGQKGPHIVTDFQVMSPKDMARNEFYRWLENSCELQHFIGARIHDSGDVSTFMSVEYDFRSAPPSPDDVNQFAALASQFASARRLEEMRTGHDTATNLDSFLANKSSSAIFFLDKRCRYLFANPSGEKLISEHNQFVLNDGFVCITEEKSNRKLNSTYKTISENREYVLLKPPPPIAIKGDPGQLPVILRVFLLPYTLKGPGNLWSNIGLIVQTENNHADEIHTMLIDAFGLSSREAEFVFSLRKYGSNLVACDALGIAKNTGRVYMQRVFAKMGINSQTELMTLIERFSAWHLDG